MREYDPGQWGDAAAGAQALGSLDPGSEHAAFLLDWNHRSWWRQARDEWIAEHDPVWAEAEFRRVLASLSDPV